jgi:hypothetical protein
MKNDGKISEISEISESLKTSLHVYFLDPYRELSGNTTDIQDIRATLPCESFLKTTLSIVYLDYYRKAPSSEPSEDFYHRDEMKTILNQEPWYTQTNTFPYPDITMEANLPGNILFQNVTIGPKKKDFKEAIWNREEPVFDTERVLFPQDSYRESCDSSHEMSHESYREMQTTIHALHLDPLRKTLKENISEMKDEYALTKALYSIDHVYTKSLIEDPIERENIFQKTHMLFADFIRDSYSHRQNIQNSQNFHGISNTVYLGGASYEEPTPLTGLANVQEIPVHLRTDDLSELFDDMFVLQALKVIKNNVEIMSKVGLGNPIFIIYIVTYHLLLKELYKYEDRLNCKEVDLLKDLIYETEILYMAVNVNISNERLKAEVEDLRNKLEISSQKEEDYYTVLTRLDRIEVTFTNGDTPKKNKEYLMALLVRNQYCYSITNESNVFTIKLENPEELIITYNTLIQYHLETPNIFQPVFLFRDRSNEMTTKDRYKFTIGGTGTSWALVFYLLYGPNTPYTKERDNAVRTLINLSETTGIPLSMLLPKYDNKQ